MLVCLYLTVNTKSLENITTYNKKNILERLNKKNLLTDILPII